MDDQEYLIVMAKLKFIGSVGENQFINLSTESIQDKNVFSMAVRKIWYKTENGQTCARYCRGVIVDAFKLLDRYANLPHLVEYSKTILKYIWEAKQGIDNLKATHSTNTMAYAMFDSITVGILQKIGEKNI